MFRIRRRRRIKKRTIQQKRTYAAHKEAARQLVQERLQHFNQHYKLTWHRVAIRDTRTRWGSCSELGNLNFNYRIVFLPHELQDYLVVHELCHLAHLHHRQSFWDLVAETIPDYRTHEQTLRKTALM